MESEEKEKRVETAEAHVIALQKQSADLLLEYDRLLEENQNLQSEALGTWVEFFFICGSTIQVPELVLVTVDADYACLLIAGMCVEHFLTLEML